VRPTEPRAIARPSFTAKDRYLVQAVVRSVWLLRAFEPGEELRASEVHRRCGLSRSMTFRLLHTLVHCDLLERTERLTFIRPGTISPALDAGKAIASRVRPG